MTLNTKGADLVSSQYYFEVKSLHGPRRFWTYIYDHLVFNFPGGTLKLLDHDDVWSPKVCFLDTFLEDPDSVWEKTSPLGVPKPSQAFIDHLIQMLSEQKLYPEKSGYLLVRLRNCPIGRTLIFKAEGKCLSMTRNLH
jgi:hypothetical protein